MGVEDPPGWQTTTLKVGPPVGLGQTVDFFLYHFFILLMVVESFLCPAYLDSVLFPAVMISYTAQPWVTQCLLFQTVCVSL